MDRDAQKNIATLFQLEINYCHNDSAEINFTINNSQEKIYFY